MQKNAIVLTPDSTPPPEENGKEQTVPPLVSLCTVTYNRSAFLPLLQKYILAQTYPRDRMEWVLVDDSDDGQPGFKPDHGQGLSITHQRLDRRLPLGQKRNLSHTYCKGDIIIYLDDDDYYPPTRVAHAVEQLANSKTLIAGSTILPILFLPEREIWLAGPYGNNHATAGTFAFKRQLLDQTRYDDEKTFGEERSFLKDYSFPMIQLDAGRTILCIAHDRNTFEKRRLIAGGNNPKLRRLSQEKTQTTIQQLGSLIGRYENLLSVASNSEQLTPKESGTVRASSPHSGMGKQTSLENKKASSATVTNSTTRVNSDSEITSDVNICIISNPGDLFSLCFLDIARYLRYKLRLTEQFKRVHLSKNRLRRDAVNIILGAHAGFDASNCSLYHCIFMNLEQLGNCGKKVQNNYLQLLQANPVIDYDPGNQLVYRNGECKDIAIISFGYAPYLNNTGTRQSMEVKPMEDRSIDLLFYGSVNDNRLAVLRELAASGLEIKVLDNIFGPERDKIILDTKLVINTSYYEKSTFEQARAFHCLSLGTPILSITSEKTNNVPNNFRDAIFFLDREEARHFLATQFKSEEYYKKASTMLDNFRKQKPDGIKAEQDNLVRLINTTAMTALPRAASLPKRINLGSGRKYMPGWINIDISQAAEPDLTIDLSQKIVFPFQGHSNHLGPLKIEENSIEIILADNVLENVSNLAQLMSNCLSLLKVGGKMEIIVPHEKSPAAWQDPNHVRAFNQKSWLYYTKWCWYLGWFYHRFSLDSMNFLNEDCRTTTQDPNAASFQKVVLTKVEANPKELNSYRLLAADFGPGLDD